MSGSAPYSGAEFLDDVHALDQVNLVAGTQAAPIGTGATDMTVNNVGGVGPYCPNEYLMVLENITITNISASLAVITISKKTSAGSAIPLVTVQVAANATVPLNTSQAKLICSPLYKFQVVSTQASSAAVNGLARLIKGAGY